VEGEAAAAVRAVVEPAVRALGYELILVELAGAGGRRSLRLYIDQDGGVGLSDCVAVSREVSALLDVEDPIDGPFVLEVSSPGVDRPLVRPEDFERFTGELVKLRTRRPVEGRRTFSGVLIGLIEGDVVVEDDAGDGHRVPLDAVKTANVDYRFDRQESRGNGA